MFIISKLRKNRLIFSRKSHIIILWGENMIKTTNMLLEELNGYASPKSKLSRMVNNGEYFPIVKGLYETNKSTPPYLLAGSIYGPSYISFDYALSYYGLIPEAAYAVTSATYDKKKRKHYETSFGNFLYRDVPAEAFPLEIKLIKDGDYYYRIASPEKALCDKLYTLKPVKNVAELQTMLIDNLRMDEDELKKMDLSKVRNLASHYGSTNIKSLCTLLRRMQQ